jgi:hypothetical protein
MRMSNTRWHWAKVFGQKNGFASHCGCSRCGFVCNGKKTKKKLQRHSMHVCTYVHIDRIGVAPFRHESPPRNRQCGSAPGGIAGDATADGVKLLRVKKGLRVGLCRGGGREKAFVGGTCSRARACLATPRTRLGNSAVDAPLCLDVWVVCHSGKKVSPSLTCLKIGASLLLPARE